MRIFKRHKKLAFFLKLRYMLFAFRKPLRIGFLRLYNEKNTIIPCLMSVVPMFDKIVIIYSHIDDGSLELAEQYIKQNALEEKFIIRRYPYEVYTQHSPKYQENFDFKNSLAAYYKFGYDICREFARFRNGFIAKIDADQIYMNDCFDEIEEIFKKKKYSVIVSSCGGYNGYVNEAENTYSNIYSEEKGERNGNVRDHLCVPFGLCKYVNFVMDIAKDHAWELVWFSKAVDGLYRDSTRCMWFHFNKKPLSSFETLKPFRSECYKEYTEKILPLLKESGSDYVNLKVITE